MIVKNKHVLNDKGNIKKVNKKPAVIKTNENEGNKK